MSLRQVVYMSEAQESLAKGDIEKILAISREDNAQNDVTGLLIYFDGVFMQALEGESDFLDSLLMRISEDIRHHDFGIVSDRTITERVFPEWKMAFIETDADDLCASGGVDGTMDRDEVLARLSADENFVSKILLSFASRLR